MRNSVFFRIFLVYFSRVQSFNPLLFMEEIIMNNPFEPSIELPCTLFETIRPFDDVFADDMQCGDMDEQMLLSLGLQDISARIDPFRLIRYNIPGTIDANSIFYSSLKGVQISYSECVDILFAEMKELSQDFSLVGEYKSLIIKLIEHFRYGNGVSFSDPLLDSAYNNRICKSGYDDNHSLNIIKRDLKNEFKFKPKYEYYPSVLQRIRLDLSGSTLPKFNDNKDKLNGLGVSIHDIAAQRIKLFSLEKYSMGWDALIHFEAQDHFGLDKNDIKNDIYRQLRFFRIWFFLQRYKRFAFKPFFTNFMALIRIEEY